MSELVSEQQRLLVEHGGRPPRDVHTQLNEAFAEIGGTMYEGRLPMNDAEHDAVDDLIAKNDGAAVTLTRSDPGNVGALVVHLHLADGDVTKIVEDDGKVRKPTKTEQTW